jgi:hypothetical protein
MKRFDAKNLSIHKGYLRYKRKYCHRLIWEEDVGPIPEGFDVHHKDGNKLNNLLNNLECISKSDHMRLHAIEGREKRSSRMKKNSVKVHAWLKTEKGKKFLSDKAKKQFEMRPKKEYSCEVCSVVFTSKHTLPVKYCSDNCVMKARRLRNEDMEERHCIICSNPFIINKYQKTKTCSKPCRAKHIGNLKRIQRLH